MRNNRVLITGGVLRENGFELGEGKYYGAAKLLLLDTTTGHVQELVCVTEGNDNFPAEHPNLEFTVGDVDGSDLWLATDTEIRLYDYQTLNLRRTYSYPCFHNIHSVASKDDDLYVTSTGLDLVVVLDKRTGQIKRHLHADGKPIWHRFRPDVDYRRIHSTRPHDCHPNYVFWLDNEPWVTRCTQEDAVQLNQPSIRIDVSGKRRPISVHDGIVHDGLIHFTTVDGTITIVDASTKSVIEQIDLTALTGFGGLRGWCRGLYLQDSLCFVGFSRLRRTRRIEKLHWVNRMLQRGDAVTESSILAVDLKRRAIVRDYRIPAGMIDAIYSVLPEPVTTAD